ncbi:hypothetical protein PV367_00250 [Streptomyces europaeiscabiei]|uniref:Uncharacterized protein n=2 Tax=Streptomyces europaeiscabiei TaxID=146819 RepID=A0AAJ2PIM5_9ACTN|nr:hypothetical protein [Streptomyces europaeiscabiei]
MVHVPRTQVIVDPLASLPDDERERLVRSEVRLIKFLERQARDVTSIDR